MSEATDILYKGIVESTAKLVQASVDDLAKTSTQEEALKVYKPSAKKLMTQAVESALKNKVDELEILDAIHKGTIASKKH